MAMPAASAAASSGGAPAAKRVKTEPGTAAAGAAAAAARPAGLPTSAALPNAALLQQQQAMAMAMAGMARPPLPPGSLPGAPGMAQISAAQQAVYAQQRLQQALLQRPKFAPIVRPASEDERQFVPRQRLQVGASTTLGRRRTPPGEGWQCLASPVTASSLQQACCPISSPLTSTRAPLHPHVPRPAGAGAPGRPEHVHPECQGHRGGGGGAAGGCRGLHQQRRLAVVEQADAAFVLCSFCGSCTCWGLLQLTAPPSAAARRGPAPNTAFFLLRNLLTAWRPLCRPVVNACGRAIACCLNSGAAVIGQGPPVCCSSTLLLISCPSRLAPTVQQVSKYRLAAEPCCWLLLQAPAR